MQTSFSELEYAAKKKQTRRDRFLSEIEAVTPWVEDAGSPVVAQRTHPRCVLKTGNEENDSKIAAIHAKNKPILRPKPQNLPPGSLAG